MHFFAFQAASPADTTTSTGIVVVAIVTIFLLFISLMAVLGVRQTTKNRQLLHEESMKALELGRTIGPSEAEKNLSKYVHNVFWICFWLGGGVPIAAVSAAGSVIVQARLEDFAIILAIWICTAVISVAGVVCATTLMISARNSTTTGCKTVAGNGTGVLQR